jgi:ADP-ribosyl-[dinitrogen reductase] hydrolase
MDEGMVRRAQGCLLGQLAGDALGSVVEFQSAEEISSEYPWGVRTMADGGTFNTIAGQPTDDSELALLLARLLVADKAYDPNAAFERYRYWLKSEPFDCGATIHSALQGRPNAVSQANGALMRVSPLGIFGAGRSSAEVAEMARADAGLTHPHPVCLEANALFAMAIAEAIRDAPAPDALHGRIAEWARQRQSDKALQQAISASRHTRPENPLAKQGWVLIAFQNALYQLLHTGGPEEGIAETISLGGDTDTNAAIAGALLGAVHGREAIPEAWVGCLQQCRPEAGAPRVRQPRPEVFWPCDVMELGEAVLRASAS